MLTASARRSALLFLAYQAVVCARAQPTPDPITNRTKGFFALEGLVGKCYSSNHEGFRRRTMLSPSPTREGRQELAQAASDVAALWRHSIPNLKLGPDCAAEMLELVNEPADTLTLIVMLCSFGLDPQVGFPGKEGSGDPGQYYQCTEANYKGKGGEKKWFKYWKAGMGSYALAKPSGGGGLAFRRQLQHHHYHHHGGSEGESLGVCLPAVCTGPDVEFVAEWLFGFMSSVVPDQESAPFSFAAPPHPVPPGHSFSGATCPSNNTCPSEYGPPAPCPCEGNCIGAGKLPCCETLTGCVYWTEAINVAHNQLNFGGWIVLFVFVVFFCFAAVASVDAPYGLHRPTSKPAISAAATVEDGAAETVAWLHGDWRNVKVAPGGSLVQVSGQAVLALPPGIRPVLPPPPQASPNPFFRKVVACWDLQRNWASLLRPEGGHPGLKVLNGLRVIAIALIALCHTYAFGLEPADNELYASQVVAPRFSIAWIISDDHNDSAGVGFNSVDTFFFLSGFLATWAMLEKIGSQPGLKFFQGVALHRYLRLTPL